MKLNLGRRYNCSKCKNKSKNVGLVVCFEVQNQRYKSVFLSWFILDVTFFYYFPQCIECNGNAE